MKTHRNLWPVGIVVALVLFVAGTTALVVFAVHQREDLVNVNYYEQELRYQSRIDSLRRARELGAQASIQFDAATRRIIVLLPAAQAGNCSNGQIELYRPSAAGLDRRLPLNPDTEGRQVVDVSGLPEGLWRVRVSWKVDEQEYYLEQRVVLPERGLLSGV